MRTPYQLSLLLLVFLLAASPPSWAFRHRGKQFVPIYFGVNVHSQIADKLAPHAHLLPAVQGRRVDPLISCIKLRVWQLLEDRLEGEAEIFILPINAYGDRFDYDAYGFPNMPINRAIRVGDSRYYMRFVLTIGPDPSQTQWLGIRPGARRDTASAAPAANAGLRPKVTLTITTFSDHGIIPIDNFSATAQAPAPWDFGSSVLNGLVNDQRSNDPMTLWGLINEAITQIIPKFE